MQEFIEKFKQAIFEDDVYIVVTLFSEQDDNLIITFDIFLYGTEKVIQSWKVTCKKYRKYKLINEFFDDMKIFKDHILLWEFNQAYVELFYTGRIVNKFELIGKLLSKHLEVTEGWIDYDYFLNKSIGWKTLEWFFSGDNGLLASGPAGLLNEYRAILEEFGLKTSLLPSKKQQTTNEVLIFMNSYVIAEEFIFEQMFDNISP